MARPPSLRTIMGSKKNSNTTNAHPRSAPLRVLHILNELRPSGAEVLLRTVGDNWKDLGVRADIVSTGPQVGVYADLLQGVGYGINHIPFRKSPAFFLRLWRLVRTGRYQVVHIHTERANFWYAIVARLAAARPVRSIHNVFNFSGSLRVRRMLQRAILRLLAVVQVAVSESVQSNELRRFGNRCVVINNWYDERSFLPTTPTARSRARRSLGITDDRAFVIVTVGNCAPAKNHLSVLRALSSIDSSIPFAYLHVGEEDHEQSERRYADNLGNNEHVSFLGWVESITTVLNAADAFVMASHYEGCGIAVIEAMACGLPILASEVDGLRDFKKICAEICWCCPDSSSIAEGIMTLMNSSVSSRLSMRESAATAAASHFSRVRGARRYAAVYQDHRDAPSHAQTTDVSIGSGT
jgi:glycosyltransferase involved in cell wall biosynthesis